jgi:excisionase family DNA binding protein
MAVGEGRDRLDQRSSEVAAEMGLSAASIQAYARKGRIPYRLTPGRQYRFSLAEVRELLAPAVLAPRAGTADVFTARGPLVNALSGYRTDPVTAAAQSRLRSRGHRTGGPVSQERTTLAPAEGSAQLDALIRRSGGAAVAVLHRA